MLAGWNAAGVPLIVAAGGVLAPVLALGDAPNPTAGIIQLATIVAAIVAIATRPAGVRASVPTPAGDARLAFIGPMVAAVAFVSGSASTYLGIGLDGLVVGIGFIVITAAMVLGDRLPVIDANLRRALILPFMLICGGIFNGFAADVLDGLDVGQLISSATVDETGFGVFVIGMLVAGLATFYAALIVAPRMLVHTEAEHGCVVWPVRFALFLASAAFGIGWLAVLAG